MVHNVSNVSFWLTIVFGTFTNCFYNKGFIPFQNRLPQQNVSPETIGDLWMRVQGEWLASVVYWIGHFLECERRGFDSHMKPHFSSIKRCFMEKFSFFIYYLSFFTLIFSFHTKTAVSNQNKSLKPLETKMTHCVLCCYLP